MPQNHTDPEFVVSYETARSIGKLLFGALVTVFVLWLLTLLPGFDRLLPGTPLSAASLLRVLAAVTVAGVLVYAAGSIATLTVATLSGPRELLANAGSIVYWLVVLAAILLFHWGVAPTAAVLLEEHVWIFDTTVLLAALGPIVVVTARLYAVADPAADRFADRFARRRDET